MKKELQDYVWQKCGLPKEFKEEVKSKYKNAVRLNEYAHECVVFRDLFGEDNLTSDAEGEEILMVRRKKVQAFFMNFKCEKSDAKSTFDKVSLGARMSMLHELFGSKCLPDELNEDNFAKSEPKPAEPKNEGTRQEQYVPKNAESGTHSFNHILKDGFHDHNRLHIAAQITASIYSNDKTVSRFDSIETLVRKALDITDTLIAEAERTDKLNK